MVTIRIKNANLSFHKSVNIGLEWNDGKVMSGNNESAYYQNIEGSKYIVIPLVNGKTYEIKWDNSYEGFKGGTYAIFSRLTNIDNSGTTTVDGDLIGYKGTLGSDTNFVQRFFVNDGFETISGYDQAFTVSGNARFLVLSVGSASAVDRYQKLTSLTYK